MNYERDADLEYGPRPFGSRWAPTGRMGDGAGDGHGLRTMFRYAVGDFGMGDNASAEERMDSESLEESVWHPYQVYRELGGW